MARIKFGTDGWRAVMAEDFTFANLDRVAQASAEYWKINSPPGTENKVVVGFDRRFLSEQFAQRTAEVLAGNGFAVTLTEAPTPTPAVSLAVRNQRAVGGVMITASHNPPAFNGFKLKAHFGGSADSAICKGVEAMLDRQSVSAIPFEAAVAAKRIQISELRRSHFQTVRRLVDYSIIAHSKLKVAHDALFGVGADCFKELLSGTTCKVTTLNGEHDVLFGGINPEPITKNYRLSIPFLQKHPHDICLVTDGDADRIGAMDGIGRPLSTHQLVCLFLRHFSVHRKGRGRVVKALSTTSMVDKMCAAYGLPLTETGVGFKFICAEMAKGDVLLGFEESGGVGFPGHIPERDGILAGMVLLELLAMSGRSIPKLIAALEKEFGPHRYARIDCPFPLEHREQLMEYLKTNPPAKLLRSRLLETKSFDGIKFVAEDSSWLMIRGSGTEPILRIYAETSSEEDARRLVRYGSKMTEEFLKVV